jgi:hypothetical protein
MGDYFADFVQQQTHAIGLTLDALRAWAPSAPARRGKPRAKRVNPEPA